MAKRVNKRFQELLKKVDKEKKYSVDEALANIKNLASAKFDETIEVALKLNVDPRHADQMVRGSVVLPAGTGKTVRVAVIAKDDKADEARAAGADIVGSDDLIEEIQAGRINFDVLIATPNMMGLVGKVGRILGPKGIMPNPKTGTVTMGNFKVKHIQEIGSQSILPILVSLEKHSSHPIATSILEYGKDSTEIALNSLSEVSGKGIIGKNNEHTFYPNLDLLRTKINFLLD